MSVASISLSEAYKPDYEYEHHKPGHKFNIKNKEHLIELNVNGYIARFIQQQKHRNYRDEKLWEAYVSHFEDWTKELFDIADRTAVADLRDFLRENGVFVFKAARIAISGELARTANEEKQHKWTDDEIAEVLRKDEPFNSRHHPNYCSPHNLSMHAHSLTSYPSPSAQLREPTGLNPTASIDKSYNPLVLRHLKAEADLPNPLHKNFEKIPHPPASNMAPVSTSEFVSQVPPRQARLDQAAESKLRELTQRQSTVDYYQDYDCPRLDTALPIPQVQCPKIQPPQQPNIFPSVEAQGQQNEYRNQGYNQSFPGKSQKRSNFQPTVFENYPPTQLGN
ncbi:hypothetical protein K3495_g11243 [Podosphaera aphanis]|nr:hypothetical protein K3495_g11243 [Podosphaera aphanis]